MSKISERLANLSTAKLEFLAQQLKKKQRLATTVQAIPRRPEGIFQVPLSFAQQRLWFLDQLEPGSSAYNIPGVVRLRGCLDSAVLKRSLDEVVSRHESLRTTFAMVAGQPMQVIAPEVKLEMPVIDLRCLTDDEERAQQESQLAASEAQQPFDLAEGPLLRATLLRRSEDEYTILLTMHHIISDFWSEGVLLREIAELYQAYTSDAPSPLSPLPIQYADYALWQRDWLSGERLRTQLDYWKRQLDGMPALLEMPTDRPRPPMETYRGDRASLKLPAALTEQLKQLARVEDATLFMTLLAAFQILLCRYSGQEDIAVGSPIANRRQKESEGLIGFFANTLVLRTNLSGNPTFGELLARVREMTLEAYAHQDLPFEKLVEELQLDRDMSRNPLFQVMFVLQNTPRKPVELPDFTLIPLEVERGTAKFDLTFFMVEYGDELHGSLEYNVDMYDAATITRMLEHFRNLLEGIVAAPAQRIWMQPLMSEAEKQKILYEWNDTKADFPRDRCVHQLFEAQVERTPEAVALVFEGRQLTYAEVNRRANQLAHYLQKMGVGPEVLVGVCVERSIEMVVGWMAVLKAGGAAVALDATYPLDRLAFMIRDAGMPVLLTQRSLLDSLPDEVRRVCLDDDRDEMSGESMDNLSSGVTVENLIYAIYTSGSTGMPKGIGMSHAAFLNLLYWQYFQTVLGGTAKTVQYATFGFCVSFQEICSTLCGGGTLAIASDSTRRDMEILTEFLRHENIERLHLPFAALKHLAEAYGIKKQVPASLREVITAGEQLQVTPSVRALFAGLEGCSLHNQYGTSETHVVSALSLTGSADTWPTIPPVGRPIANTQIYLLDRYMQPVPIGVLGELYVGGECLSRAYLNSPEVTAEKFIPNPFARDTGARLYRTGDLARHLPGGDIEYLGRVDLQVKIRGFRIELGEVESVARRHPSVRDVAVVTNESKAGAKRLVAYIVFDKEQPVTSNELRAYLKTKLPEYMIPSIFMAVEELPINANGKLDQQALPAPEQDTAGQGTPYRAPRTPLEEVLAGIWMQFFDVKRVGIDDNFFELGGHSLLATQVITRVRHAVHINVPLRCLFETPTVGGLANHIEALQSDGQFLRPTTIKPVALRESIPLSFAQQRLWFLDQLDPGGHGYNITAAVNLNGNLDMPALHWSINKIVQRHEALRTTFAMHDGKPVQVIAPEIELPLPVVSLAHLPEAEREAEVVRRVIDESKLPFDLNKGPLVRVALLHLAGNEHVALLTMHHIVSDGWSMEVFIREVSACYDALTAGRTPSLPQLPIQYPDFAQWQREWLSGAVLESQLAYWREQLGGNLPVIDLPTDRPRPAVQTLRGARHPFMIPSSTTAALKALSISDGATLFMTLLAAFDVLLQRHTGQDDILVGTNIANRNHGELENLIGFFTNNLVLRTDMSGDPTFRQLLGRVREVTLGAYAHQDLPFERLVEELRPVRDPRYTPLFQVMLVLQNIPPATLELHGLTLRVLDVDNGASKFDLSLFVVDTPEGLKCSFEYNTDLFNGSTIERLSERFQILLQAIAADFDGHISAFSILREESCQTPSSIFNEDLEVM